MFHTAPATSGKLPLISSGAQRGGPCPAATMPSHSQGSPMLCWSSSAIDGYRYTQSRGHASPEGPPQALFKIRIHEDWVARKCGIWMHLAQRVGIHVDRHIGRIPSRLVSCGKDLCQDSFVTCVFASSCARRCEGIGERSCHSGLLCFDVASTPMLRLCRAAREQERIRPLRCGFIAQYVRSSCAHRLAGRVGGE